MGEIKIRKKYTAEFKKDAVKLVLKGDRKVQDVAEGLGIYAEMLYKWIKKYKQDTEYAFPGNGKLKPADEEIRRLKKQLQDLTEERDILKKVVNIFSRTQQPGQLSGI